MAIDFPDNPFTGQVYTFGTASWKWDGVAWRRIPDPGAKGEDGDDGTKGEAGQKGEPGFGDKGQKGEEGQKGLDGDGTKGQKGEVEKGEKGDFVKGEKGQKGEIGIGEKGDKGEPGEKGEVEAQGNKGQKGEVGQKGDEGLKGEPSDVKGQKGEIGVGDKGQKGDTGDKGDDNSTKGQKGDDNSTKGQKGDDNSTKGQKGEIGEGDKGDKGDDNSTKGQKGDQGSAAGGSVPSGSTMLFYQSSAPTGWTKVTSHNNKALRVVSGSGGGSGGSQTFTNAFQNHSVSVSGSDTVSISGNCGGSQIMYQNTTQAFLSVAQLASHQHAYHAPLGTSGGSYGIQDTLNAGSSGTPSVAAAGGNDYHTHAIIMYTISGSNFTFSGSDTVNISGSGSVDNEVQYIDVIICTKN